MLLWPFGAPLHERPNGRRRGVQDRNSVFLYDAPETVQPRGVRSAFVHQGRGASGKGSIDKITVACHPANICGAPEQVLIAQVKDVLRGHFYEEQKSGSRVQNALWL